MSVILASKKKDALETMFKKEPVEITTQILVWNGLLGLIFRIVALIPGPIIIAVKEIGSKERKLKGAVPIINVIVIFNGKTGKIARLLARFVKMASV
jgi:hypothetical protein